MAAGKIRLTVMALAAVSMLGAAALLGRDDPAATAPLSAEPARLTPPLQPAETEARPLPKLSLV